MADSKAADPVAEEVKALIRFYERRGWNWLDAAEFTLSKYSGRLEYVIGRRPFGFYTPRNTRPRNGKRSEVAVGAERRV